MNDGAGFRWRLTDEEMMKSLMRKRLGPGWIKLMRGPVMEQGGGGMWWRRQCVDRNASMTETG